MFKHTSKSPSKRLFKEDKNVIGKRFFLFMLLSVGLFIGNDLADMVDKTTEVGGAVAMLLTWLGNAMYLYYKDSQTPKGGNNGRAGEQS